MRAVIVSIGWRSLLARCRPVGLLALILFPLVWLISLPLRLIGLTLGTVSALLVRL